MSDQVILCKRRVPTAAVRRRNLLRDLSIGARERGDVIHANLHALETRLICYLWDLPIPDEVARGPV